MGKKIFASFLLLACIFFVLTPQINAEQNKNIHNMTFSEIVQRAKGTKVSWYMYGGWAHVNLWVDTYVKTEMKKKYDIDLVRVPMDAGIFVNKLLNEKAAGKQNGNIDLLWINGENFKNAKQAGLLFGPFANKLPNVIKYVDEKTMAYDFGYPVNGYEVPYGKAQFVFEYNSDFIKNPPNNLQALEKWIFDNPGLFTYPQPPDFTGSAFIRQVFYALTGGHEQYMAGWNKELFEKNSVILWNWLNKIKPYLWQKGRTYPKSSAALDTLFSRGETAFGMSYHPSHAQSKIIEGTYPNTVKTFVLENGSIFNTHFTAIPFNSPNKAGAMVLANFLISPQAQLSKYNPNNWGDFPALDLKLIPKTDFEKFQNTDLGSATLSSDILSKVAVPEIPSEYLEALELGWKENVLDK